jgi:hypothetical protein
MSIQIAPLIERYRGPWEASPSREVDPATWLHDIQAITSLRQRMDIVTAVLDRKEFTVEAWGAAIYILELFGHAYPTDRFHGGHLDPLRMIWFVLIRNAAVSPSLIYCWPLANTTRIDILPEI